jgi:hypothetical protein
MKRYYTDPLKNDSLNFLYQTWWLKTVILAIWEAERLGVVVHTCHPSYAGKQK